LCDIAFIQPQQSLRLRVITAALAGGIIFAGTAIAIDWVNKKEAATIERDQPSDSKFGVEFFDRVSVDPLDNSRTREILMKIRSTSDQNLTNIHAIMQQADGPIGLERLVVPKQMKLESTSLNPGDYFEIALARHREFPKSPYLGLNMGEMNIGYNSFQATQCDFVFHVTASGSAPVTQRIKIWVDGNSDLKFEQH
jgi:hypothetical protein